MYDATRQFFGILTSLITALIKLELHATGVLTFSTHTAGSFLGGPPQGQGRLWGPASSASPLVPIQLAQVPTISLNPANLYSPLVPHVSAVTNAFPVAVQLCYKLALKTGLTQLQPC